MRYHLFSLVLGGLTMIFCLFFLELGKWAGVQQAIELEKNVAQLENRIAVLENAICGKKSLSELDQQLINLNSLKKEIQEIRLQNLEETRKETEALERLKLSAVNSDWFWN